MTVVHLALVSESQHVPSAARDVVAAALQLQVLRDFLPAWDITATVDAFDSLDDVPSTYWPIIVADDIPVDAAGIHLDKDYKPYALVNFSNRWTLTASHEALEMLADPFGVRLQSAMSIDESQGMVDYLVEVCDPSEAVPFSYRVNGVVVSDFYFPNYFEPVAVDGVRYSFTGAITRPTEVLDGGYISWHDTETNHWWQQRWFGTPQPTLHDLGVFADDGSESVRAWLDSQVRRERPESVQGVPVSSPDHTALVAAYVIADRDRPGRAARAARLRSATPR
jgi:hypothetical protein